MSYRRPPAGYRLISSTELQSLAEASAMMGRAAKKLPHVVVSIARRLTEQRQRDEAIRAERRTRQQRRWATIQAGDLEPLDISFLGAFEAREEAERDRAFRPAPREEKQPDRPRRLPHARRGRRANREEHRHAAPARLQRPAHHGEGRQAHLLHEARRAGKPPRGQARPAAEGAGAGVSDLDRLSKQAQADLAAARTEAPEPEEDFEDFDLRDEHGCPQPGTVRTVSDEWQAWASSVADGSLTASQRDAAAREHLAELDKMRERRIKRLDEPNVVGQVRVRAEAGIAQLDAQIAALQERLGHGSVVAGEEHEIVGPSHHCRHCGTALRDSHEAFDTAGLCGPCWTTATTGGSW